MLFLALARAAGFHAEAMVVVNRDRDFFQQNYLDGDQLDDLIVWSPSMARNAPSTPVSVTPPMARCNGRTPGRRPPEQDGHTAIANSPGIGYKDTIVQRMADLTLASDGTVTGTATIISPARMPCAGGKEPLKAIRSSSRRTSTISFSPDLPPGIVIHTDHFLGLEAEGTNLMVRMKVGGSLGTATGKRIFLPLSIFAAGSRDPFASSHREEPIDLDYPYLRRTRSHSTFPPDCRWRAFPRTPASICRKMRSIFR